MKANFNLVKRINPAKKDEQLWYAAPACGRHDTFQR